MGKNHKGPFVAGLRVWHSEQGRFDRREGKGSQRYSEHKDGYNAVVGLGRSPAIHRGSPHFQADPMALIDALEDVGGDAQARGICDDGKMDVLLLPVVVLPQTGVVDGRFEVWMRNPRDQYLQDRNPITSYRLAHQLGQGNRDLGQPMLGALGHRYP